MLLLPAAALAALVAAASPGGVHPIAARWRSASRLTPAEAASVLHRHAEGGEVRAEDVFEAEKHLRTDGPVSPAEYVLSDLLARRLAARAGDAGTRPRVLPPVLHWLDWTETARGVRLRGETVQVAVLGSSARGAVTVLYRRTLHQDWSMCGAELCVTTVAAPVRRDAGYATWAPLTAAEVGLARWFDARRCDPRPAEVGDPGAGSPFGIVLRHAVAETMAGAPSEISCSLAELPPRAAMRVTYTEAGHPAAPPSRAARGAIVNNPLEFSLSQ
ncbi:MAG: hypothetical protein HYY35_02885 [Deltaproteobacteria bacterium]|nr:hypothetical protein [Deltaproteobacteria bacterium]